MLKLSTLTRWHILVAISVLLVVSFPVVMASEPKGKRTVPTRVVSNEGHRRILRKKKRKGNQNARGKKGQKLTKTIDTSKSKGFIRNKTPVSSVSSISSAEDLVERVFQRAEFGDTLSLQDPRLSEKVALAFHTYPWIERLVKVTKSYPARVSVEVVYREPVAMVKLVSGGFLPVDRHGVLLPTSDFNRADIDRYPHVTNVTSIPIRRGEPWGDPAVAGAAELAGVLTMSDGEQASWWKALGLKAIIAPSGVNTDASELQYRLETSGGSQIVWGRAPSTDYPAELTVAQKLERMAEYHRSYNGFDDAPAPFLIDVRGWQGTTRSLLAEEPGTSARQ